ncbi:hypothetical protein JOD54_000826 [Actinokineospora baliensis]|uniref:hypothetical protein n=1 Tax=Actinokineospora baliensis TaxID=547056 RepID=UPI0019563224|nr:hypothetical protein [Actinokineospora baliensis]MBM7770622.1 hypothetical protein [Actinokineospora baliensis]
MSDPTLPPSLAAEFREIRDRLAILERGERSVTYRDRLPTNDAGVGRGGYAGDGERDVYSAALVNPRYPVLVMRTHVQLFGDSAARVLLRADMNGTVRTSQTWSLTGKPGPAWTFHTLEIAWLHGMPVDEWADTETLSTTRRGNIQLRWEVTNSHPWYTRAASFRDDLTAHGFSGDQAAVLDAWTVKSRNVYESYIREPEYAFLAPQNVFPTATTEGTLMAGSRIDV